VKTDCEYLINYFSHVAPNTCKSAYKINSSKAYPMHS